MAYAVRMYAAAVPMKIFHGRKAFRVPAEASPQHPGSHRTQQQGKGQVFMHPEQERGDRFPSVPNAGEGFRAAGSGGVHPRREAGRKQHAQRTRYLRRNARIKPQGKFFLPDQADEDKQGSQQKPGSRNVVFISHACQQSQCHYASPLAETLFSRLSFFPVFPIFQQFPVQAQETEPEGGSPGIVGSAGEPVNRDAGPGRTGEEQEKRQSEEPHVRPGTGSTLRPEAR